MEPISVFTKRRLAARRGRWRRGARARGAAPGWGPGPPRRATPAPTRRAHTPSPRWGRAARRARGALANVMVKHHAEG